jgi:glutaredoxin
MPNVIVYSKKDCPNCDRLKVLLSGENIEYSIVKIDTPAALTELMMKDVSIMSAPVLQIDNNFHTLPDMASYSESSKDAGMLIIDQHKVMNIVEKEIRV